MTDAVAGRRSIRRFLPTPVPEEIVMGILGIASRAPSGQNMQPWFVHYVTGATRDRLSARVTEAFARNERSIEYDYFPQNPIREPYLSRRRKVGYDLYAIYGIERDDLEGRKRAVLRNFEFFGAPIGLFFTMERDWGIGAWIDCSMFMMNVMNIARTYGLETCAQQAWCEYSDAVRSVLEVPRNHVIISGMAVGFADHAAKENRLITERVPPEAFVTRYT